MHTLGFIIGAALVIFIYMVLKKKRNAKADNATKKQD